MLTLAEKMIAVGRFDRIPPEEAENEHVTEAEVAFLVQDAHQGRGIANLLLEHLAQAGRERGIDRFVADVLPENRRMIQTFRDAGSVVRPGGLVRQERVERGVAVSANAIVWWATLVAVVVVLALTGAQAVRALREMKRLKARVASAPSDVLDRRDPTSLIDEVVATFFIEHDLAARGEILGELHHVRLSVVDIAEADGTHRRHILA